MSEQSDKLDAALQNIWGSDYAQKNPSKAFKVSYPAEYNALAKFLSDGPDPGNIFTSKFGKGLADIERVVRELKGSPPPPPPSGLPARSTNVVRRFTRAHSSQFKAGRNRYVPPSGSNTSWWEPPEKVGTPWRGSIVGSVDITTPYGEGLRFNVLDEMIFLGVSQNRMCALEVQGNFPEYEGMAQQWDGHIRLPSAGNTGGFAGGFYEGHCIMQIGGTTGGGPDTNGHKMFLGDDGRLVFAIRHDDSQWADRLYKTAQPLALDTWHHVRWEILVTEASNGYHKGWVNGDEVINVSGPTLWAGETIWEMMLGWYAPRTGNDNTIEFADWQLARLN